MQIKSTETQHLRSELRKQRLTHAQMAQEVKSLRARLAALGEPETNTDVNNEDCGRETETDIKKEDDKPEELLSEVSVGKESELDVCGGGLVDEDRDANGDAAHKVDPCKNETNLKQEQSETIDVGSNDPSEGSRKVTNDSSQQDSDSKQTNESSQEKGDNPPCSDHRCHREGSPQTVKSPLVTNGDDNSGSHDDIKREPFCDVTT